MNRLTALPQLSLVRDGAAADPRVTAALCEVRVQQALSVPSLCELTFRDPPGPLEPAAELPPGTSLEVRLRDHDVPLFGGEVTAVEHTFEADRSREVRVRAYDLSHRLRKRQRVRAHVQVTPRSLAEELTAGLGLGIRSEADGPTWELLVQHRQTDLDLLVEVLERSGLHFVTREDELLLLTLAGSGDPVPLRLGTTLFEARAELNGDPACREVAVAGWDPLRSETHAGQSSEARGGVTAPAEAPPQDLGGDGQRAFPDQATPDDSHAEGIARAELDHRGAREVTVSGVAEGDPRLRPGARVEVAGLGSAFAGVHVLTRVTHTIDDDQGYVSAFDTAPPRLRPRAAGTVATLGVVSHVDDPEGRGRVKVRLPTYFDVETGWMEVVSLGAGAGKGLVLLPDVDDTVLVLLAHENPAEGLVLGGLYGAAGSLDAGGVSGGGVRRYSLVSRGGQSVRLDDERRSLRFEDATGSFVELAPEGVVLHAAADVEIAAPGRRVVIRGAAIDFERA